MAYAQIYQVGFQDVLPGNFVTFDTNGLLANVTHVLGSSVITINTDGLYNIIFWFEVDGDFANVQIYRNGAPLPQGSFQGNSAGQWSLGEALVVLSAGDTIQFFNSGPNDLFFEANGGLISANVIITKVTNTGSTGTGVVSLDGNTGSANEVAGIINVVTANSTFKTTGAGNTLTLDFFQSNSNIGADLLFLTTGLRNTGYGAGANQDITSGTDNTTVGYGAFVNATSASQNTSLGVQALKLDNGDANTAIGYQSLSFLTSGFNNIGLGWQSGINATTNNSCIYIGHPGIAGESHVQRLGADGVGVNQVNVTVIAGDVASVRSFTAILGNITASLGDVVISSGNLSIDSATAAGGAKGLISYTGAGDANRFISARGTQNFFAGYQSGNTSLTVGSAIGNTGVGFQALESLTLGAANTALGQSALTALTVGNHNVAIGLDALDSLLGGSDNVIVGDSSGTAYNTTESNNVILGANITGSVGEDNTVRIGNTSNNRCFINGIVGNTITGPQTVVIDPTDGQLGVISGGGLVTWSVITVNQTAVVNQGYFCNKAGTLALALPATSALGDVIEVYNMNTATGTQFTQAAGQQIFIGNTSTTLGTTGTLTSIAIGDSLKLVCSAANTTWRVVSGWGNWTPA